MLASAAAAAAAGVSTQANAVTADQFQVTKPRMRICFDPETEIPKLQKWFAENNHPTRQQVEEYVRELNSLESRRGRRPLDVNNVIYWFKNTRAAVKRAEMKARVSSNPPANSNLSHDVGTTGSGLKASLANSGTSPGHSAASAMWPWFNNNALLTSHHAKKTDTDEDVVITDDTETKSHKDEDMDEAEEEEASKDITDDENNSSEGQRSPPPTMVFGQGPPGSMPLSMMTSNMMYMSHYMNPYMQVTIFKLFGLHFQKTKRGQIQPQMVFLKMEFLAVLKLL